jgi:hypothetical protein
MIRKLSTIIQQTYYNFNNPLRGINFEYDIQPQVNFSFDERGARTVQWFDEKVGSADYISFNFSEIREESLTEARQNAITNIKNAYLHRA